MVEDVKIPTGKPVILCMYSGGLDSLGALYKLLCVDPSNEDHVHVHHVNIVNFFNRHREEKAAVEKTLQILRDDFGCMFSYSESTFEYPSYNGIRWGDHEIFTFMAANIVNVLRGVKAVALGLTVSDARASMPSRIEKNSAIYTAVCGKNPERLYPVSDMTKEDIWLMLPSVLRDASWSCRMPSQRKGVSVPCNRCPQCRTLESIRAKYDRK